MKIYSWTEWIEEKGIFWQKVVKDRKEIGQEKKSKTIWVTAEANFMETAETRVWIS